MDATLNRKFFSSAARISGFPAAAIPSVKVGLAVACRLRSRLFIGPNGGRRPNLGSTRAPTGRHPRERSPYHELRQQVMVLNAGQVARTGVGLIVMGDPDDFAAGGKKRCLSEPDPQGLNEFVAGQMSQEVADRMARAVY
jgi:hypothetical protein